MMKLDNSTYEALFGDLMRKTEPKKVVNTREKRTNDRPAGMTYEEFLKSLEQDGRRVTNKLFGDLF